MKKRIDGTYLSIQANETYCRWIENVGSLPPIDAYYTLKLQKTSSFIPNVSTCFYGLSPWSLEENLISHHKEKII